MLTKLLKFLGSAFLIWFLSDKIAPVSQRVSEVLRNLLHENKQFACEELCNAAFFFIYLKPFWRFALTQDYKLTELKSFQ